MELTMTHRDGAAVLSLAGEVDMDVSPDVRRSLLAALADHGAVVVHLAEVTYMDSSGVASLVEAYQTARKRGLRFALAQVSQPVLRVLQLARLDQVFPIHGSLDDALKANG